MSYKASKELLLKIDFAQGGGFQTVGGVQTRRITFGNSAIDVTNQDSDGNWQEMLAGVGKKSVRISGDGVFTSGPVSTQLIQAWLNEQAQGFNWQIIMPGLGMLEGPFVMGDFEYSGDQSQEVKFSITLNSSGALGFTPSTL